MTADEDMTMLENYMEAKEISKGIQIEKEAQNLSGSSQAGGPNQVRVHLGIQDQYALNWSPRTRPNSVFDVPYMDGKLI
jgi:hypothetical protein